MFEVFPFLLMFLLLYVQISCSLSDSAFPKRLCVLPMQKTSRLELPLLGSPDWAQRSRGDSTSNPASPVLWPRSRRCAGGGLCVCILVSPLGLGSITGSTFLPPTQVSPTGVHVQKMCWEGQGQGNISEALLRPIPKQGSAPESIYANSGSQSP